ncbi:hypothetical protein E5S70_01640 [Ensifer adhaerens]|nr:hypothetical protein [Ensifer canadensis]
MSPRQKPRSLRRNGSISAQIGTTCRPLARSFKASQVRERRISADFAVSFRRSPPYAARVLRCWRFLLSFTSAH